MKRFLIITAIFFACCNAADVTNCPKKEIIDKDSTITLDFNVKPGRITKSITETKTYAIKNKILCVALKDNTKSSTAVAKIKEMKNNEVTIEFTYDNKEGINFTIEINPKGEETSIKPSTGGSTKHPSSTESSGKGGQVNIKATAIVLIITVFSFCL